MYLLVSFYARVPFKTQQGITNRCLKRMLETADRALSSLCHESLFISTLEESRHELNY